jgi:hypothetical protein
MEVNDVLPQLVILQDDVKREYEALGLEFRNLKHKQYLPSSSAAKFQQVTRECESRLTTIWQLIENYLVISRSPAQIASNIN